MEHKSVFISYRRSTSKFLPRLIHESLIKHDWSVFLDVVGIDAGDFDRVILSQIAASAHFILIISEGSLERCKSKDDWVRREIEEAIRLERNIIPVIEEDADFRRELNYLPEDLQEILRKKNSITLYNEHFDEIMEKLRKRFLKLPSGTQPFSSNFMDAGELHENVPVSPNAKMRQDRSLSRRKHVRPQPILSFLNVNTGNLTNEIAVNIEPSVIRLFEDDIERRLQEEFDARRYQGEIDESDNQIYLENNSDELPTSLIRRFDFSLIYPSAQEVQEYHTDLMQYIYTDYRHYLMQKMCFQDYGLFFHPILLVARNIGPTVVKNVDVELKFPTSSQIYEKLLRSPSLPYAPKEPRPKTSNEILFGTISTEQIDLSFLGDINRVDNNYLQEPTLSIDSPNRQLAEWGTVDIKNGKLYELPEIRLFIGSEIAEQGGIQCEYTITANNLLDPVKGTLSIVFNIV